MQAQSFSTFSFVDGSSLYFSVVNTLNNFWSIYMGVNNQLIGHMLDCLQGFKSYLFVYVLVLILLLLVIALECGYTVLYNKYLSNILTLFLDIQHGQVKRYIGRCEQFSNVLQTREVRDIEFDDEADDRGEEESGAMVSRKRRRRSAVQLRMPKFRLCLIVVIVAGLEALHWKSYAQHKQKVGVIANMSTELNITAVIAPCEHYIFNLQNLYIIDSVLGLDLPFRLKFNSTIFDQQFALGIELN